MRKILIITFLLVGLMSFQVLAFNMERTVSGNAVTLTLTDSSGISGGCIVEETFSNTLSVTETEDGLYDSSANTLRWIKLPNCPNSFTYSVEGTGNIKGTITSNGIKEKITGDTTITKVEPTADDPGASTADESVQGEDLRRGGLDELQGDYEHLEDIAGGKYMIDAGSEKLYILLLQIKMAMEKNVGSPLKQLSEVAGVFRCYYTGTDCSKVV